MIEDDDYDPTNVPAVPPPGDFDPIAASRARNQAYMERVRREQEQALRGSRENEIARLQATYEARRRAQQAHEEHEDVDLRRALEESRALAEAQPSSDARDEDGDTPGMQWPPTSLANQTGWQEDRVYDDEDAELQAALKASLEDADVALRIPESPSLPRLPPPPVAPAPSIPRDDSSTASHTSAKRQHNDEDDVETESEADTSIAEESPQLSMEEMRRKRLAKFGG